MPRITGRLGSIYLATVGGLQKVAETRSWELEVEQEVAACPIKGEVSETYAMGGITSRITCERINTNANDDSVFASRIEDNQPATGNSWIGVPVQYQLDQIDGAAQGASITGSGVITRGSIGGPRELATETIEIMGTTVPAFS